MTLKLFSSTIVALFCLLLSVAEGKDKYANYAELSRAEREGKDFSVLATDRKAPVVALAIHGGKIEPGTDTLARAVAREDLSLYVFESKKNAPHDHMHLTAHHFDEPRALALVKNTKWCVSVHSFNEPQKQKICVGGDNAELRQHVFEALRKSYPFDVQLLCDKLQGLEPLNIVNRCLQKGVQLELSIPLTKEIQRTPKFAAALANVVRRAIFAEQ